MRKLVSLLLVLTLMLASTTAIAESITYAAQVVEGEPYATWLGQMAEEFEEETGIEVEVVYAGRDVLNKMKSSILIGDPPDMIEQNFENMYSALLAEDVLLEPLNDFLYNTEAPEGDEGKMIDVFFEDAIKMYQRPDDDNIYLLPFKYNTSGFFYNKKMFEKYGLTEPQTWDEFLNVCKVLKDNGIAPLTLDGNINYYNFYYFYWLAERIMGTGALRAAAEDKTGESWKQEGFLKTAQLVAELAANKYFQEGYEGSAYPAAQSDWAMGGSAMILMGSWIVVETKSLVDDTTFEYGFFPMPVLEGGKGDPHGVEISYVGAGICKGGNVELSQQFLRFLCRAENIKRFCDSAVNMPARAGVEYPVELAIVKGMMDESTSYHKIYDSTNQYNAEWQANVMYPLDNELVFGTISAQDFIDQLVIKQAEFYANK